MLTIESLETVLGHFQGLYRELEPFIKIHRLFRDTTDRNVLLDIETWMKSLVEKMFARKQIIFARDLEAIAKIGVIFGETYLTET